VKVLKSSMLADDFVFLEGLTWHNGGLWVSDMWDFGVIRISTSGTSEKICDVPNRPSGMALLPDGTLVLVSMKDRKLMRLRGDALEPYVDLQALATGDLNDLVADEKGNIYVGHFGYDLFGGASHEFASVIHVDVDGVARTVAENMDFPNGMVLKDDGKTLVVAETWSCRLTAFDRLDDGSLANRRVYADLGERMPDGVCVDQDGGIWVACFNTGEVVRVLSGGKITDRVYFPGKRAVSCVLGGEEGRTLFCSTFDGEIADIHVRKRAGAIETVIVDVPGHVE